MQCVKVCCVYGAVRRARGDRCRVRARAHANAGTANCGTDTTTETNRSTQTNGGSYRRAANGGSHTDTFQTDANTVPHTQTADQDRLGSLGWRD